MRIGLAVLERLRALDPVSYLRFASVYKGFDDLADFEAEVVELQKTVGAQIPRTGAALIGPDRVFAGQASMSARTASAVDTGGTPVV